MARILIGNIKGPQGIQGPKGATGPIGPAGPQGPLPPLINNGLATQAGVAALDAVMGKTLTEGITQLNSEIVLSDLSKMKFIGREKSLELIYFHTSIAYYRLSISKIDSTMELIYSDGTSERRVWSSKDDIPRGLSGKQVLYGTTSVTTDGNGAGWIPFAPNFKDANSFLLIGQTDSNMVDRVTTTIQNNGASVRLFKNGTAVGNSHGWVTWLAIGNPI